MKLFKYFVKHCGARRKLSSLAKGTFEVRVRNAFEQWGKICRKALTLYNQGMGFTM